MSRTHVFDAAAEVAELRRRVADLEAQVRLLAGVQRGWNSGWPPGAAHDLLARGPQWPGGPASPTVVQPGEKVWLSAAAGVSAERQISLVSRSNANQASRYEKKHEGACWRNSHGDCGC